jgi:hypothetical protein
VIEKTFTKAGIVKSSLFLFLQGNKDDIIDLTQSTNKKATLSVAF